MFVRYFHEIIYVLARVVKLCVKIGKCRILPGISKLLKVGIQGLRACIELIRKMLKNASKIIKIFWGKVDLAVVHKCVIG